ncbi:MAG: hypothetical protein CLLPBCKN_001501 [Chroococcidiopsis cubana SAG 39.79]|jgi:hypothetical protein|uniref:Uncharacterized protein n=1 Tax=Chroococcidiopsis cubana SAG 39.79 TaxID=388085 RepID=A0AB37U7H2_9CYAN|nr:hypothetical protein [Chroococcidiopsis cubana]MDZ4872113.1 hypothetical protein [Chroococcidiopsis cubana SAG 39.79]RUS92410.1 hypothetical protein DSM107010_73110 [Chroococcidiopsis cubana SAG 39.79]
MPSHNQSQPRTIVVSFQFFDSTTAVAAVLPVVEELIRQIHFEQHSPSAHLQLSAQINFRFSFCGSKQALALVTQTIDNSAYELEELRSTGQLAHFELSYESRD